ncbi:MAG: LPS export ABC transporter periplasmic protein LptC [Candidatus Omnitrophota bacterium]
MLRKNFGITILLILIFASPCFAEEKKEAALQEVKDFSFVQYQKGGGQKWKMNGKSAEVLDNKVNIEYLSALSFGQGTMLKLKAREGSFDKGENMVYLRDNVVAVSTNGTKLTTDHLVWNHETKNVSTEASVNIKKPNMDITGTGAVCDIEGNTAELKHNINAKLVSDEPGILDSLGEKGQTVITCDGPLELNYKQNRAFFHGNVKIEDSKGSILSDRIDVYFSPETKRVKCVVARGNVKIINGGSVTYSEKAIYLVDQGRVILPNRPKLIITEDKP